MSNTQRTWKSTLKEAHTKFVAINPEKAQSELGFAMQIFQNSVDLQRCDPQSILNAVVNVARTSVTLNPVMKLAYLVPRKGKCVLDFSYMGLVAMLRENNCIKSISAHVVFEDEQFEYDMPENKIYHKPQFAQNEEHQKKRKVLGCYSRAKLDNDEIVFEFIPMWEIDKIKKLSGGSSHEKSTWNTFPEEMYKKCVIKRHFKTLISLRSIEKIAPAIEIENDNNGIVGIGTGGFGVSNQLIPQSKSSTLFSSFDIEEEPAPQQSEPQPQQSEQPKAKSIDFTNDEIDAFLNEEAMKINGGVNESESRYRPEFLKQLKPIDLFAEDEQIEEGGEEPQKDNTNSFPNPPQNGF